MGSADTQFGPPVEYFAADFSWEDLKEQLGVTGSAAPVCDTETGMHCTIPDGPRVVRAAFIILFVEG